MINVILVASAETGKEIDSAASNAENILKLTCYSLQSKPTGSDATQTLNGAEIKIYAKK